MPRAARYALPPLRDLRRQLVYAPPETRRRQMDAAESLVDEIDAELTYPADFVVWRITGYRRDEAEAPVPLDGAVLIGDLTTFIQELSADLDLRSADREEGARTLEETAADLGVSIRTLQRLRRLGLVCHYVDDGAGPRLSCYADALDRFRARHPGRLESAGAFSRIAPADRTAVINEARRLRTEGVESLGRAARTIARRRGRAVETVRLLLLRHDERGDAPIFRTRGPLPERTRRLIERAWRRAIPLPRIAERVGRSPAAVHRQVVVRRRQFLATLSIDWVELPTFDLDDAAQVILGPDAVHHELNRLRCGNDALQLAAEALDRTTPEDSILDARLAALNLLLRRAADARDALGRTVAADVVDAVETDLRWASSLLHVLVADVFGAAVRRIEAHLGQPIVRLTAEELRELVPRAVEVTAETVRAVDPSRGQRLGRLVPLEMDKALSRQTVAARPGRAGAGHGARAVPIDDVLRRLTPWQAWLEPPPHWFGRLPELPDAQRHAVERRYGLAGDAPLTMADLAAALDVGRLQASRTLHAGEAALWWPRRNGA